MKRLFSISTMLIFVFQLSAQSFTLTGTVTDDSGETMPGASVQIKGTFLGATSNRLGAYEFKNLDKGEYQLMISFLGYETQEQTINLDKDTEFNVQLQAKALMSDEVIIKATRASESIPVAQTTIRKDDIRKMNVISDIPYQLELTPSVVATSETGTGTGYSSMRIRGTGMSRINMTINGVPLNDGESQGVYFVNMPDFTASVNSIQIQRGVGTSTNGAASFGASVNFQTLTLEPKPYAQISSSVGSFNTFKENIAVGTGLINDKFTFDVRYSKLNSDGYIDRGFSDHESMYLSAAYYGEKDMLKAIVILGKQKTGITWWGVPCDSLETNRTYNPAGKYIDDNGNIQFYDGQTDNYWQNHYQLLYSREISKHLNVNATLHATTGKGYYEQYKPMVDDYYEKNKFSDYGLNPILMNDTILKNGNNVYIFPDSTIDATDMIRQKWLENVFYGGTANLNYHKGNIDATIGIAGNNYDGDHFGNIKWTKFNTSIPQDYEWYRNNGTKTNISSFLKVNYAVTEDLSIFADIQVRDIKYTMYGTDDDLQMLDQDNHWTFVNPKAGVNYQINQQQRVYLSYAMANREPARADLKEALKEGGTTIPQHETLNDIEFGYQIKQKKYIVGVNMYYMLYDNQLVNTGERNSVGYKIKTNVKNSYRRGIEIMGAWQILKKLQWNANFTYSQNKNQDFVQNIDSYDDNWNRITVVRELGETNISYSPELIGASQFRYEPLKNFGIQLITKYVSEQYIDNTSNADRKLDPYLINNLGFDYAYQFKKGPKITFQFFVNNILDANYISNADGGVGIYQGYESTWMAYYPQAGRNFMFKTALTF